MTSASIAEQLRPLSVRLKPHGPRTIQIVQVTADLGKPGSSIEEITSARNEVLRWLSNRAGALPKAAWEFKDFKHEIPGRVTEGVRLKLESGDYWCIRNDDPDKNVPGRTWTTEASVAHVNGQGLLGLRLSMSTSEDDPDFTPSVPGIVRQLSDKIGLYRRGRQVTVDPQYVDSEEELDALMELLTDPMRRRPIYVVSLGEDETDIDTAVIDPVNLAVRCLGIAHVAAITGPMAFGLSDHLGKQLSTFGGAVRCYNAGFDRDSDRFDHPLYLPARIETWSGKWGDGPRGFVSRLVANATFISNQTIDQDRELPSFRRVREFALEHRRIAEEARGASDNELLGILKAQLEEKKKEAEETLSMAAEEDRLRQEAVADKGQLEGQIAYLRQRNAQLEAIASSTAVEVDDTYPETLDELNDWAEEKLAGRVVLTPRALRDAKGSSFADVAQVFRCLEYLAGEYRDMRIHGVDEVPEGETKLASLGVQNLPSGKEHKLRALGDAFLVRWGSGNRKHLLDMHLKNGGNTRDPARCLRIYYFWDDDTRQVIVGSLPAHLRTDAT